MGKRIKRIYTSFPQELFLEGDNITNICFFFRLFCAFKFYIVSMPYFYEYDLTVITRKNKLF